MKSRRGSYHHGDLRNALVAAATELARAGGPEAVVLREAARRVGVSATAAYRHFDGHQDLLLAVKAEAQEGLADTMERVAGEDPRTDNPAEAAELRLRALGRGYIRFALEEPGLFRTAFCHEEPKNAPRAEEELAARLQVRSYDLLGAALDGLVEVGLMPVGRRPFADTTSWAAVHGLALLILDGPLAVLPPDARNLAIESAIDVIVTGLCRI